MQAIDIYSRTHELDPQTLDAVVARLEYRAQQPIFIQILAEYIDQIDPGSLGAVLDMGCGTGFVSRYLVRRPDFHGRVLGLDLSPHLVAVAARLTEEEGLAHAVEYRVGDSRSLDLAAASFDAVLPHTLVSHVYDPTAVIGEAARVVKPGGVVVVFDGDYGSLTVGTDDPEEGVRMDAAIIASVCASPRVMRTMPRILHRAGLTLEASMAYVLAEIGQSDYWAGMLNSLPVLLPKAGLVDAETARSFVEAQQEALANRTFFCSANFYTYIARRPV